MLGLPKLSELNRLRAEAKEAKLTLKEASFLIRSLAHETCPEWDEGIGDCEKPECMFCRAMKCANQLDDLSDKLQKALS